MHPSWRRCLGRTVCASDLQTSRGPASFPSTSGRCAPAFSKVDACLWARHLPLIGLLRLRSGVPAAVYATWSTKAMRSVKYCLHTSFRPPRAPVSFCGLTLRLSLSSRARCRLQRRFVSAVKGNGSRAGVLKLILYSKPDCHLCHGLKASSDASCYCIGYDLESPPAAGFCNVHSPCCRKR